MRTSRTIMTCLLMAIAAISMAQVTISTSQLNGTRWRVKGEINGGIQEYTMSLDIWHGANGSLSKYPYYLTNTPITSYEYSAFDHSKVGKKTKGRYLVSVNEKLKITYCVSIQSFDKTKGIFVAKLVTEGLIGTGDGMGIYELVK